MPKDFHIPIHLRVLAFVCRHCVICNAMRKRAKDDSGGPFAAWQRFCIFCQAFRKVRRIEIAAAEEAQQAVSVHQPAETP